MKTLSTLLFSSLLAVNALNAADVDGYEVYKKNCKVCHMEHTTLAYVKKHFKELKAPPIMEVSNQLKRNIIVAEDDDDVKRELTIAWIMHYIENPSIEYSMCNPGAIDQFGIMPSLKGVLKPAEKRAVAEWLVDEFEDKVFK